MNTLNESWKTFIPTKKQRRIRALKAGLSFTWQVFLHLALIACVWVVAIIGLSL